MTCDLHIVRAVGSAAQVLRMFASAPVRLVLHFDETRAVEPLERTAHWEVGELPETYPHGL